MRNVTVLAVLVFCLGSTSMAKTPPAQMAPTSGYKTPPANYHPHVSPDIAALQAQERSALARGDVAAARELERQVQAILIEQQHVVPQSASAYIVKQPRTGESFTPDQLIYSGPITALSADWELDGTMWAAFATAAESAAFVFRSTDHGASWDFIVGCAWEPAHIIDKIELVVGPSDTGFLYVFENIPDNDGDLMMLRFKKDGTSPLGATVRAGPDTVTDFTVCRDYSGDNYWLYAIAHNGAQVGDWPTGFFLRSADYGATWVVTDETYNKARPRMAFGQSWVGYTSAVPASHTWQGVVQTGVNTNWSSPGGWKFYDFQPDTFAVGDACIAPAFTAPAENATVWIAYSHNVNGTLDWDVLSAYAHDTLLLWNGPYVIANTGHTEGYVDLRNFTEEGNPYVNVSYCDMDLALSDNAWLGYSSSSSPSVWTALSSPWVNKYGYVGWGFSLFPRIVYSPGSPGSGGGLVFAGQSGGGYFNAPWFTGVAENRALPERPAAFNVQPSVARGPVRVNWSGSATRLVVTDVAGRIVRSSASPPGNSFVWDGKVPAGTYLVCLTTSSGTATRPVVIQ